MPEARKDPKDMGLSELLAECIVLLDRSIRLGRQAQAIVEDSRRELDTPRGGGRS